MALTVTYSIAPILNPVLPTPNFADNSDTIGYTNGYFVTIADDSGGSSSFTFYDPAGNVQLTGSSSLTDCKSAFWFNGDVLFAGNRSGGGIGLTIETNAGHVFGLNDVISTDARDTNADVADLGFDAVVVYQRALSASNHDIMVSIVQDDLAHTVTSFAVDSTAADDRNASVAQLFDGGFAVVWERIMAAGTARLGGQSTRPMEQFARRRSPSTPAARSTMR